jgi:hypothetical protein
VGALQGARASKGIIFTASAFSGEAEQYAASVSPRVVLVDGERLAVSKSSVIVYHGISQPMRAFRRSMSVCGAREANASVVSRALRWATWATWSATMEQPMQACSGQPDTPGSKKAR